MENEQFGSSSSQADWIIRNQIQRLAPKTVVDFGAGAGKNCQFVRELAGTECHITAVEGYDRAAEHLRKNNLADKVMNQLIEDWNWQDSDSYDLAIFGDVLEHLTPRAIRIVIRKSLSKFKYIIVQVPLHDIFQDEVYDNQLEVHCAYITHSFFDKYSLIEKHICLGPKYNIMNVLLSKQMKVKQSFSKKMFAAIFHFSITLLQPLGLARPLVVLLKKYLIRFKFLLKD